ncbi:hypothetical protein LZ554_009194 [Drepanopeziza brunnea f. sp. 'monogermtubi']|nr:hypothetical protein LZ554_009194 [Drepanopeziza brunnea f. sp. 'monogermtubi']
MHPYTLQGPSSFALIRAMIIPALSLTVISLVYWRLLRRRAFLAQFDGPPSAAWLPFWMVKASVSKKQNLMLWECSQTYGPFARIGPKTLLISDPEYLWKINSVRGSYTRGPAYHAFRLEAGKDNILSSRDEVRHMELRKKMTGGYSKRENPGLESSIDAHVTEFLNLIDEEYLQRPGMPFRPVDLSRTLGYFTLDVITDIAFGSSGGYVKANADVFDFFSNVAAFVPVMSLTAVVPSLLKITEIPWLNKMLAPSSADRVGIGRIMSLAKVAVEKRYSTTTQSSERLDMLAAFKRHGLTKDEAEIESVFQILAGTDTTATALRGIFLYLSTTPTALNGLRAEFAKHNLLAAATADTEKTPNAEIIPNEQLESLPYMSACIKEGLRLHPPATGYLEKQAPAGGDHLPDGRHVPEGTGLAYNAWGIMRSRTVFGDDADLFRPERWLESLDSEKLRAMNRSWELGFSSGKWRCLGKDIALMEINKVVAEFVRRYDIAIVDPGKPWDCTNWGLWLVRDFWFSISPRRERNTVS